MRMRITLQERYALTHWTSTIAPDYAPCMGVLADNIVALLKQAKRQEDVASAIGVGQSTVSRYAKGAQPGPEALVGLARYAGVPVETLVETPIDQWEGAPSSRALQSHENGSSSVEIQHINLAYGLGATFTDSPVDVDMMRFPKIWVETITSSPPALLTWTRGRGDSMLPTIDDGDLILLDRSQRKVTEQDALWAFTVGDTGSIKRLRVKGDRFQILSDNASVPPDEEPIDFVNIVARVVFVGKRK